MSSAGTEGVVSATNSIVSGVSSGAAAGAAIGAAGGPIGAGAGALIGGAVGIVAGAFGFGSSKKKRKARKLAKQSRAIQNLILRKGLVVDYIQQQAIAEVSAVASGAGTQNSSGINGVMASLMAQTKSSLKVNSELFSRNESIVKLEAQAEKMSAIQSGIGSLMSSAESFVGSGAINFGPSTASYVKQANAMGVHNPVFTPPASGFSAYRSP